MNHFTNRRGFFGQAATGLSGIALASLLAEEARAAKHAPLRPTIRPEAPLAAQAAAFRTAGQASARRLLLRRGEPCRYVRLQTGTREARRAAAARRRQARHLPRRERQPDGAALDVSPARQERQDDERLAAEDRRTCRRHLLLAQPDREEQHARTRRKPNEHRLHARRLPRHGRLGHVRARHGVLGPAGVRRRARPARRTASGAESLELGVPAGGVSGDGLQRRQADCQPYAAGVAFGRDRSGDARLPASAQSPATRRSSARFGPRGPNRGV